MGLTSKTAARIEEMKEKLLKDNIHVRRVDKVEGKRLLLLDYKGQGLYSAWFFSPETGFGDFVYSSTWQNFKTFRKTALSFAAKRAKLARM